MFVCLFVCLFQALERNIAQRPSTVIMSSFDLKVGRKMQKAQFELYFSRSRVGVEGHEFMLVEYFQKYFFVIFYVFDHSELK